MRKLGLLMRIFRALWSTRKGDHSMAHVLRQTDEVMGAGGFGKGAGPAFSDEVINALYRPEWSSLWHDDFILTAAHLDLIKRAQFTMETAEAGAPKLSVPHPYEGGATPEHLDRLLGADATEADRQAFLISMVQAFSVFCDTAQINSGTYTSNTVEINLTDDLIALVRNLQWDWPDEDDMGDVIYDGEVAGPRCDCKRPYGDMSFFALDVHRILGWDISERDENGYIKITDEQVEAAQLLHNKILPALTVFVQNAQVAEPAL